jgi:hypothetical protein
VPFPKSLGACADALYAIRVEKAAAAKALKEIEERQTKLTEHIIDTLPKGDAGAVGKVAKVVVGTVPVPIVEDWDKFYAYVAKTKRFDMLQRRLGDAAVKEMWEAKKTVPGVGTFNRVTVSLTKV